VYHDARCRLAFEPKLLFRSLKTWKKQSASIPDERDR